MPNDVIPDSRNKSWEDQQTIARKYQAQGYALLSVIDGACCLLLKYVQTGKRCYSDKPGTLTRCVEKVLEESSEWLGAIGGFASVGLSVSCEDGDAYESYGLSLARNFY